MINVVEDIAKVMKYDKYHNVKVVVKPNGITVSLSEENFDEVFDIPIKLVFATLILLKILWNILKII